MNKSHLTTHLSEVVKQQLAQHLGPKPLAQMLDIDAMEALSRHLVHRLAEAMFEAWVETVSAAARAVAGCCPGCGARRICKTRPNDPMGIRLLGVRIEVPKLYLVCQRCRAPGISITKVLTGLKSGAASAEVALRAAYVGSQHSYGKASRDMAVHYGVALERTAVRRLSLQVEAHAMLFAEHSRREALETVSLEQRRIGAARLMLQGDGGSVRTGQLAPCKRGDRGYGQTTAKRGRPKRKRLTQGREVITLDVRQPGECEPTGLDVLVPHGAPEGERARRMLALAARQGLGDTTCVVGLGDMGSGLPQAFTEAFVGYDATYVTDWKHICDYVHAAAAVLTRLDAKRWAKTMRTAIWQRDVRRRDALLARAQRHRVPELPAHLHKCPVAALQTYLHNNWHHMRSAQLKDAGLDYVSARAEAQVRDRTKDRFAVAGAWRVENLEPKATLRAIIAEGRWEHFRADYLAHRSTEFHRQLTVRLQQAIDDRRLLAHPGTDIFNHLTEPKDLNALHIAA